MKKNDIKSLHSMSVADLQKKQQELFVEFARSRMQHKANRLKNVRILSSLRDDVARVSTVLAMKQEEK
ncbi:50S ribosomal protein L29 [Candidatus Cerribacteria bacterium 'Amazon FNV 2010 28 9']|uniref:Large ribosomal subunit protein uL29 n=1 Tax=Candidatus Cerribacteria bacterium 'Amazon FNV 2010 28 9' TaxID=2081795 RepID=A0A317JPD5_9BACT|nr:MAG: 50S ribosomal protein L29 [Candidatus Cerribacteria bacterium 'Amazon FNV 2010 28 9']